MSTADQAQEKENPVVLGCLSSCSLSVQNFGSVGQAVNPRGREAITP